MNRSVLTLAALMMACSTQSPAPAAPANRTPPTSEEEELMELLSFQRAGGEARIVRDERGVPNIIAADLQGAMYALGYAQAEDRLFQMFARRLRMEGRLAEFFAVPDADGENTFNDSLLEQDRIHRTMGLERSAAQIVREMDAEHRGLLEAFVAGINDQIESRDRIGTAFGIVDIDTVEPWETHHALLGWDAIGERFGSSWSAAMNELTMYDDCKDGGCTALTCGQYVVDEDAAIVPEPEDGVWPPNYADDDFRARARMASLLPISDIRAPVDVKASQGFVVSGRHLTGGRPLVFGEPQLVLEAPSVWYEHHIQVPSANINARGVGFAGSPGMVIFYNRHASQTVTAGGGDNADLFRLTPGRSANTYVIDGREEAYEVRQERIAVRGGATESLTVRESRFGPVITEVLTGAAVGRAGGEPFAMKRVGSHRPGDHSVIAGIELMRAHSLSEYRDALRHWSTPTVNALYAGVDEDTGEEHIAFHSLLTIPDRALQRVHDRNGTGRHPYDGSDSSNDWAGLLDLDWNPHVIDPANGYLFSGNHLPVGTWYDAVVYSGVRGAGDSLRSYELRNRLGRLTASGPQDASVYHALHVDSRSAVVVGLMNAMTVLEERGVIPADEGAPVPANAAQRAARTLTYLRSWADITDNTLDSAQPLSHFAYMILGGSITGARAEPFACEWAAAEGGVAHFLREFAADPSVLGDVEADFILNVIEIGWGRVFPPARVAAGESLRDLLVEFAGPGTEGYEVQNGIRAWTVGYQRDFSCLVPTEGTPGNCNLSERGLRSVFMNHNFIHTISSTGASSWPFTVDFADVDDARALLAPGIDEDPRHEHFDSQLGLIEQKGAGDIDGIPNAPLTLTRDQVASVTELVYEP